MMNSSISFQNSRSFSKTLVKNLMWKRSLSQTATIFFFYFPAFYYFIFSNLSYLFAILVFPSLFCRNSSQFAFCLISLDFHYTRTKKWDFENPISFKCYVLPCAHTTHPWAWPACYTPLLCSWAHRQALWRVCVCVNSGVRDTFGK